MFVRKARAILANGQPNPMVNVYHVHFKGGGSCRSFSKCRARWCADPAGGLNKPGLMSSLGMPGGITEQGLLSAASWNMLRHANQVMLGYCSSDQWIGKARAGDAVSIDPNDNAADVSSIAFHGADIVAAAFDKLSSGFTISRTVKGQTFTYNMPPITKALILSGDSAGASGVANHIDRLAATFATAKVVGVLDAGGMINLDDPRVDFAGATPQTPNYKSYMRQSAKQARSFHVVRNSALDASCIALTKPSTFYCFDTYYLAAKPTITTPILQRSSLADALQWHSLMPFLPNRQTQRDLAFDSLSAAVAANANLSILGANCTRHVVLRNNRQYKHMRPVLPGPTVKNAIENWLNGCFAGACSQTVRLAGSTGTSDCP